jgi:hypothetical protein
MRRRWISGTEQTSNRALMALAAREPLSDERFRPTEGTRCEKTHRQGPGPGPDAAGAGDIRGMSGETWSRGISDQGLPLAFVLRPN